MKDGGTMIHTSSIRRQQYPTLPRHNPPLPLQQTPPLTQPSEPQPPPQPPSPMEEGGRRRFNPDGIGKNIEDSATVLDLSPHSITVRQIKVQYMRLSRVYHPDKHDTNVTGLTPKEALDFF